MIYSPKGGPMNEDDIRKYAQELGRRGGDKRAENLTPERRTEIAKLGSDAAKAKLPKDHHKEAGKKGAEARWKKAKGSDTVDA